MYRITQYPCLAFAVLVLIILGTADGFADPFFEQSDLFVGGEGGYHTYRIPAMAVMPGGTVLAFVEGRKKSPSDAGDIDLMMRRSTDGGRTWSRLRLVYEEGGSTAITIGNPTPIVDRETGKLHLLFSRNNARLFVTTSSDDGRSFTAPVEITAAAKGFDYNWTRLGPGPTAGIQTSAGRLLAPVWLNSKIGNPDKYRTGAIYSDNHGITWRAGRVVPVDAKLRGTNESTAVELVGGKLYMTLRTNAGTPARGKSTSSNGGQTWSQTEQESGINAVMSGVKTGMARYSTKADSDRNRLVYSAPAAAKREHMTVWISEDEAATWPVSREIHHGPSGYSEVAISADKTILVLYERGSRKYYEKITLARFNLEWLNDKNKAGYTKLEESPQIKSEKQ
ncbi:MAG: exo-alpha-sialidase [Pirellulales bacterium]|nr:exo-alpha-sialidase [Pirellulales bacterium]